MTHSRLCRCVIGLACHRLACVPVMRRGFLAVIQPGGGECRNEPCCLVSILWLYGSMGKMPREQLGSCVSARRDVETMKRAGKVARRRPESPCFSSAASHPLSSLVAQGYDLTATEDVESI